jgi:beta-glucanase (GH16 family)
VKKQLSYGLIGTFLLTLALFSVVQADSTATPTPTPTATSDGWTQVWSDEFEGKVGSPVDSDNWLYDKGSGYGCNGCPDHWGTGELETMTDSTDNIYLDGDGHLAIKPIKTGVFAWTSGRIETQRTDFQAPKGGILAVEGSIQFPDVTGDAAQGYWSAFWMLGDAFRGNYLNWPSVGEIDIVENVNGLNIANSTLHCGIVRYGPCNETNGLGDHLSGIKPSIQSAFHTYRVELDTSLSPQELRFYVDGDNFFTIKSDQFDDKTWKDATDHSFFIILNVAIGGGWPGLPNKNTESDHPMLVDYVRVFTHDGAK